MHVVYVGIGTIKIVKSSIKYISVHCEVLLLFKLLIFWALEKIKSREHILRGVLIFGVGTVAVRWRYRKQAISPT